MSTYKATFTLVTGQLRHPIWEHIIYAGFMYTPYLVLVKSSFVIEQIPMKHLLVHPFPTYPQLYTIYQRKRVGTIFLFQKKKFSVAVEVKKTKGNLNICKCWGKIKGLWYKDAWATWCPALEVPSIWTRKLYGII